MSWAALANNQCISLNNLQNAVNTGVFTLKNAIPSSSKQITKADAFFYVNIDAAYPPYANKASNQLVVKSDLISPSVSQVSIFIDNNNSLNIPITGMTINGVPVTYSSGSNFTITAGNNGDFSSTQIGNFTVVITYGSHISGQKLTFIDSSGNVTCKNLNGSAGNFPIPASNIIANTTIYVYGEDGSCI